MNHKARVKCKNAAYAFNIIANVVTALAFVLGLYQFWTYRCDQKIQHSLELNSRLFESTIAEAREKIDLNYKDAIFLENIKKSAKKEKIEEIYNNFLQLKAFENSSKFALLYDYYWSVAQCVSTKSCDPKAIHNSLIIAGKAFFTNNSKYYCSSFKKFNEVSSEVNGMLMKYYLSVDEICN